MNYQDILEEKLITETKTHFFMIDEKDLIKELSVHAIAELSDLNADGVCDKEVIDDAINDAQSYIASFIKIPKNPTPLLKDICVKLTIMELKRRNDFPKESLKEIREWANDLLLKMANKKIQLKSTKITLSHKTKLERLKLKEKEWI
ncbi:hypothetical protein THJ026_06500 [Campylobacter jejuni]|nr:hypothetical protein THJ026_06500 [Campylobacter jejuni]